MDGGSSRDGVGGLHPGKEHLAVVALTLLLGGNVVARVGQYTAAQTGPAIVLSLLLAALAAGLVLCCLQVVRQQRPGADGLHGLLVASWGRGLAGLLGAVLLLELVATAAGVAQSAALHLHAVLASRGISTDSWLPGPLLAAAGALSLGMFAVLPPRRAALLVCALLTVKIGIGVLLLALAARHVHYAHWIPWLPEATAPYHFGLGGVLAASVSLLGVFASVGLALGFPGLRLRTVSQQSRVLAVMVLLAMLLLMLLAALQAGLVAFPALDSTRPLSVALQAHPELQWLLPLLPFAGMAGLAALLLVLVLLAAHLAMGMWSVAWEEERGPRKTLATVVVVLLSALLALWVPIGWLPVLPGPVALLVTAALCLGALRTRHRIEVSRGSRWSATMPVLAPLAAALCLLSAVLQLRAWPG